MGLQRVRHCKINYLFPLKSTISCTTCVLSHFSCVWLFDIVWTVSHQAHLPGASVRNPACGIGHEEGSPTKHKGVIWLQGFPLSFPEHQPPKTRVGLILLYCAFPLFWHSLEEVLRASIFCIWKESFSSNPFWCLSNLPNRFPWTFYNLWIVYSPPTMRGTKLKAS